MSPDFVYASSQWDMTLQCNVISHWLGSFTDWSLITHDQNKVNWANQVTLWLAESTQNLASSMVWYCTQFHCLTLGGLNKMLINFKSTNSIGKLREISFSVLATFHSYIFLKLVGDIDKHGIRMVDPGNAVRTRTSVDKVPWHFVLLLVLSELNNLWPLLSLGSLV